MMFSTVSIEAFASNSKSSKLTMRNFDMEGIELNISLEPEGASMDEPLYPYFEDVGESITNLELDQFIDLVFAAM